MHARLEIQFDFFFSVMNTRAISAQLVIHFQLQIQFFLYI